MNAIRNVLLIALLTMCGAPLYAQQPLPEVTLSIKGHKLTAEVAANDNSRTVGLMHRRMMPENRGMLFVFTHTQPQSFWMMNTHIPLSIACIDEQGVIVNDCQPDVVRLAPPLILGAAEIADARERLWAAWSARP